MKRKHSDPSFNPHIRFISIVIALAFNVHSALAELPPHAYTEMQESAPEYIDIEVLKVKTEKLTDGIKVETEAKVIDIKRSESNLKAGDTIVIKYVHDARNLIGPAPIPILEEGKHYPAFLARADGNNFYGPAAMGRSFSVVN